ncbi:hypothetical protein Tsubulata_017000 [Turnera subulata]|uniref:AP2/ERF domain-containing protein n=1 Tax=Turnera subulata TaxID=218843 RepID=A0A9Q0FHW8_9ROSI|nr:hypothetical protein Tsubulata_017000 [Turnera subulata]
MDMTTGKSEVINNGKRHLSTLVTEAVETKCTTRRRRRDPSAVVLICNDQQGDQQQQSQGDQAPTATTVKRSSRFRGVSRHRWTGRFEAHLWDKGTWNPTQRKKGKQGAYDEEESAARAYDLAALKYWGTSTFTNFPVSEYEKELEIMKSLTKEEYLASLRRRSSGFSRGVSKYRGVARHHHNGRWEARIGRVFGNKYLYLGTYSTQEEAAHAYDIAAIEYRGINAVTNFDLSTYIRWLKPGSSPPAPLESKPTLEIPPVPTFVSQTLNEKHALSVYQSNAYPPVDSLNTCMKEDIFQFKATFDPSCTKSSSTPTALGLLHKSSVYKELVEKNLNSAEEESQDNDVKNITKLLSNNNIGAGEMFYSNGISNIPHLRPSRGILPSLESKEENTMPLPLPLYSRMDQSLWNGALSMPSTLHL